MEGLLPLEDASLAVLLKDSLSHISVVGAADEDVLIPEVLEVASLDEEFWAVCNLEVWIILMVALGCSRHHGALDDRSESVWKLIENALDDAGVTGPIHLALRGRHGDVSHVDIVCDITQRGASDRVVDVQFVGFLEPVFNGTADDARTDDSDLHRVWRADNWLSA